LPLLFKFAAFAGSVFRDEFELLVSFLQEAANSTANITMKPYTVIAFS
jgi:hypothetical protein